MKDIKGIKTNNNIYIKRRIKVCLINIRDNFGKKIYNLRQN